MIRIVGLLLLVVSSLAQARMVIDITQGEVGAAPIAIVPFSWEGGGALPEDISGIVKADLARSGQFVPLDSRRLPAQPHTGKAINFAQWQRVRSDHIVVGRVLSEGDNFQIQFQLFDLLKKRQLAGYSFRSSRTQLRNTAHQISDIIYEKLTGKKGAFTTHIAYVMVSTDIKGKRSFQLAIADADGASEQIILASPEPLMSPTWSPDGRRLAYVSFENGRSNVFVQEVASGRRYSVANFKGINSAPGFSPDGQRLVVTLSKDGNPEIYIIELDSRRQLRITNSRAIDTEAVWAPDGRSVVFTSDRGGKPQLYQIGVDRNGAVGRPRRLTYEGDYNARATYSPDGKYIAMVHRMEGDRQYRIGLLNLQNKQFRLLSKTHMDESPSFAPNGSMLIYASEASGRGVLYAVSVEGDASQRLSVSSGDVREPAWSPYFR